MSLILYVTGVLALGFGLNVALKQSYNLIFFLAEKPMLWIASTIVIGGLFWFICAYMEWSVATAAWATTIAAYMNFPAKLDAEYKKVADEMYMERGLAGGGTRFHRIGIYCFIASSVACWVFFYGEECDAAGQCTRLFQL